MFKTHQSEIRQKKDKLKGLSEQKMKTDTSQLKFFYQNYLKDYPEGGGWPSIQVALNSRPKFALEPNTVHIELISKTISLEIDASTIPFKQGSLTLFVILEVMFWQGTPVGGGTIR